MANKPKGNPGRPKGKRSEFDSFLKAILGGKYQWKRREFFEDYLVRNCKHPKQEADAIIANYQKVGVANRVYGDLSHELLQWREICKNEKASEKASKGGTAKAKKWQKWSQARRKAFTLKRLERALTKNQD
jgi:hypothetical protein